MITFSPNTLEKSADVNQNFTDLTTGVGDTTANNLTQARADSHLNYIVGTGCVWSISSLLVGTMTAGVVEISGKRLTVASVATHSFTASQDTYIYAQDNGDGTAIVGYSGVANNAASPSLPANSLWLDIAISNGTNLTSFNGGDPNATAPLVSSNILTVQDTNGNLICNRNAGPTGLIGLRRLTAAYTTTPGAGVIVDVVGLDQCTVIIPSGRRVEIIAKTSSLNPANGAPAQFFWRISEGATTIDTNVTQGTGGQQNGPNILVWTGLPTAGTHTYKVRFTVNQAGTLTADVSAFISVKLI